MGDAVQAVTAGTSTTSVTADPYDGYRFYGWTATDSAGDSVDLVDDGYLADAAAATIVVGNVDKTLYLKANFIVNQFTVTFTAGANGALTGITPQTVNYSGSTTVVTAVPDANYYFIGWSGDYTGAANPLVLTNVTQDMTLTANFGTALTVTFTAGANGSITGDTPQEVFPGHDTDAVTAVPDAHYHFSGWTGDVTGMDNPLTVTNVLQDMGIAANFAINQHSVNFIAGAHGSITGTTTQTVDYGSDTAQVTAVADTDYAFNGWSGDYTGTDNPLTITGVYEDKDITASFRKDSYTITASVAIADDDTVVRGTISPSGSVSVGYDADQVFTLTPDAGYKIAQILVDGGEVQIVGSTYTFENVKDEHTIQVTFAVDPPLPGCAASVSESSFESGFTAGGRRQVRFHQCGCLRRRHPGPADRDPGHRSREHHRPIHPGSGGDLPFRRGRIHRYRFRMDAGQRGKHRYHARDLPER